MKKLILFAPLLMAQSAARPLSPRIAYAQLTANSQAAPTANPNLTMSTCGMNPIVSPLPGTQCGQSTGVPGALHLTGCSGYRVTLCSLAASTLGGAGSAQVYYYSDYFPAKAWSRNKLLDEPVAASITTDCSGAACQCTTFPDHQTGGLNGGWIYVAPNAVTQSTGAGTTVWVLIEAVCAT